MSRGRKRQSMADDDALSFVFGNEAAEEQAKPQEPELQEEPEEAPQPQPKPKRQSMKKQSTSAQSKSGVMSKILDVEEKEATVRLTVDMPKSMHQKLTMLSARSGKKKAEIVRLLLDEALSEVEE